MTTTSKTPVREPVGTVYSSTALYQCPNDGTVKNATIVHAFARNYGTENALLTIASVNNPGTPPTPGSSESTTNEYYPINLTASNGRVVGELIGKRLLPGEFINEKSNKASSVIIELSIVEELN